MIREQFVSLIKACGQSVIDNAEDIYNNFKHPTNGVKIEIDISKDAAPCITVVNAFIPENFLISLGVSPRENK